MLQSDGELISDRQQRWVELTPIYKAVYDRVCNGFQSHYISASSVSPVTKAAEEAKYMQLKMNARHHSMLEETAHAFGG